MANSARRGEPLTPGEIYETALRLVDAGGVEALSMRKLATELGVNPMSLYHHVDDKTALIREVARLAVSRLQLPADDGSPWQEQLRVLAGAYRVYAMRHPALMSYIDAHPAVIQADSGMMAVLSRILRAAGVPERDLGHTAEVLIWFVSALVTAEGGGMLGMRTGAVDADRSFEIAVELIVDGLAQGGAFKRP
ncbi:hypothetical protein Misp01_55010 [Microtetraspora sp. NBRC 13810]|uniref:TetR/AcrR family transcriptional regulator n=1 Tax=Microtetraspora sp. NBRC 13810 TaxID=3030990 RepID=UPI0024A19012|nr:TetR/AcrR family transcriptional regulator [Microtetraspora sp. NBRC 13810]GLW10373.1 hypothetical protein Misp01_55010 [Microtetraspora sp. NBRC 13810]